MAGEMDVKPTQYDGAVNLHYPCGQDGLGWVDADKFWTGLSSAFPDAIVKVDHRAQRFAGHCMASARAAAVWALRPIPRCT